MHATALSLWVNNNAEKLFLGLSIGAMLCLLPAMLTDFYWISFFPIVALAGLVFIIKPEWLFYLLAFVLPISMEFEIGSLGTDLPSEPLVIALSALALLWLVKSPLATLKPLLIHPFTWILAIHLLWIIICIPNSQNPVVSVKYLLSKTWYLFGFYVGSYWILDSIKKAKYFFALLLISTMGSITWIMGEHSLDGFTFDSINAACNPLYRNHVTYGVFIVMVLPLLIFSRTWTEKNKLPRLLINLSCILLVIALYFTYTRGAWLAVPVMIVVIFFVYKQWMKWIIPLGIIAGTLFFVWNAQDYKFLQFAPNFETTIYHEELSDHLSATFQGEDMSTMERFHRWIAAFKMSAEHPAFGVGPNNFVENYKPYTVQAFETYISENEEKSTVHNYFILMLAEQGYPGLLISLLLVAVFFIYGEKQWSGLKNERYRKMYMACLLAGAAFWLNNLFSDLLEANKLGSLWLMLCAVMIRIKQWDVAESNQIFAADKGKSKA